MTEDQLGWVEISRHLQRMRVTTGLFLATVPAAIAVAFLVPYRGSSVASPLTVTLTAAVASLWIGFAANRDAGNRLEKIRRAFAVHGDESRLLRDHWLVVDQAAMMLQLLLLAITIVSLWGMGPGIGVWLLILGALMMGLTWPTARKTQLLLGRARALRGDV